MKALLPSCFRVQTLALKHGEIYGSDKFFCTFSVFYLVVSIEAQSNIDVINFDNWFAKVVF